MDLRCHCAAVPASSPCLQGDDSAVIKHASPHLVKNFVLAACLLGKLEESDGKYAVEIHMHFHFRQRLVGLLSNHTPLLSVQFFLLRVFQFGSEFRFGPH